VSGSAKPRAAGNISIPTRSVRSGHLTRPVRPPARLSRLAGHPSSSQQLSARASQWVSLCPMGATPRGFDQEGVAPDATGRVGASIHRSVSYCSGQEFESSLRLQFVLLVLVILDDFVAGDVVPGPNPGNPTRNDLVWVAPLLQGLRRRQRRGCGGGPSEPSDVSSSPYDGSTGIAVPASPLRKRVRRHSAAFIPAEATRIRPKT
jgi:hypothetical protein